MPVSSIKIEVKGLKEVDKALESLTVPKFRKAALRRAGRTLMTPVLNDAKSRAPIHTVNDRSPSDIVPGELKNDIKMSSSVNVNPRVNKRGTKVTSSSEHELKVTVKTGKATEDYALVMEYGADPHVVIRDVAFGKQTEPYFVEVSEIKPQPYMRPALDKNVSRIINGFGTIMWDEIQAQLKKQDKYTGGG